MIMKKTPLEIICEALDIDEKKLNTVEFLNDLDEWDSVGVLSLLAILDDNNENTFDLSKITEIKTVKELIQYIEGM